jgi:hypothetical protein
MGRLRVVWIVNSELQGGSPRLCRLRPVSVGSEWTSIWNVLTHTRHMESPNWIVSCVNELDDSLPSLTGVQWDSVWATHSVSIEAYEWKTTLGRGRTRPTFWSRHELLPHVVPPSLRVSCCQVYTLGRLVIDSNLHDTLRNGWWLVCRI